LSEIVKSLAAIGSGGLAKSNATVGPQVAALCGGVVLLPILEHGVRLMPVNPDPDRTARDGTETLLYSWRLFAPVTPRRDWQADIRRIGCPVLVLAAEKDFDLPSGGLRRDLRPASAGPRRDRPRHRSLPARDLPRDPAAYQGVAGP
jgi:pimeloyl-ACP methyl ester carboxylesterase